MLWGHSFREIRVHHCHCGAAWQQQAWQMETEVETWRLTFQATNRSQKASSKWCKSLSSQTPPQEPSSSIKAMHPKFPQTGSPTEDKASNSQDHGCPSHSRLYIPLPWEVENAFSSTSDLDNLGTLWKSKVSAETQSLNCASCKIKRQITCFQHTRSQDMDYHHSGIFCTSQIDAFENRDQRGVWVLLVLSWWTCFPKWVFMPGQSLKIEIKILIKTKTRAFEPGSGDARL